MTDTTISTSSTPELLFYSLEQFRAAGGPGRTKAYELAGLGLLELVKSPHGKVGVTAAEVRRYFAASTPIALVKRDTSRGTAASLRSRGVA